MSFSKASGLQQDRSLIVFSFVSVIRAEDSSPTVLRSYTSGILHNRLHPYCTIWQAARATSAASTFFEPITIGPSGQKFIDGALRHNNPINLIERESKNLWPNDDRLILSIGSGDAPGGSFEGNLKTVIDRLRDIVLDSERTSNTFLETHREMMHAKRLFRFTVPGLGVIGLDEPKQKATIVSRTDTYLEDPRTIESLGPCIEGLASGGSRIAANLEGH